MMNSILFHNSNRFYIVKMSTRYLGTDNITQLTKTKWGRTRVTTDPGNTCNTKECEESNTRKKRFKGIETFLRRIAFNLGNSPSQTEVKIISCIPIDVTDLQNKIICLERQLFEATYCKTSTKHVPVHTALIEPTVQNTNTVLSCKCSEVKPLGLEQTSIMPTQCGDGSSKTRKSAVSSLFPTLSTTALQQDQPFMSTENCIQQDSFDTSIDHHQKRFFRKCKKKKSTKKKENRKTQLVYYAHAENSPFTSYGKSSDIPFQDFSKTKVDNVFSKTYLSNVIKRHFDPEQVVEEFSDTSNFTSPVCRDFHNRDPCHDHSDACSCCHGRFQNVDKYIHKTQNFIDEPNATHLINVFNKDIYYDSNLYDVIPVKEKTVKVSREEKIPTKELKRPIEIRCWPKSARTKLCHQTQAKRQTKMNTKFNAYVKPICHLQEEKFNINLKTPKYYKESKVNKRTGPTDNCESCCIDCGEVYPKPLFPLRRTKKLDTEVFQTVFQKNAECLTIDVDTKNLTMTRSIQIDINSTEKKTEETLNQIKSILQSVLAEIKTSPQVNNLSNVKSKKDAVIQKGPSHSNIQEYSSHLHSYNYNNLGNSKNYPPTSHFCCINSPYQHPNYTQNLPLVIQTQGFQKCGCVYKHSSNKSTPAEKQEAHTATNTNLDYKDIQSGETEKLIKEIYKSLTLTMDFQKDTSNSEYDEIKSITKSSNDASDTTKIRNTELQVDIPGATKRDVEIEALMTPLSTSILTSDCNHSIRTKSDAIIERVQYYLDYDRQSTEHEMLDTEEPRRRKATSTITEHYSKELTTYADNEEAIDIMDNTKGKTEKKGLFKRMLGSVKLFNTNTQRKRKDTKKNAFALEVKDVHYESDSDNYETIYSEKINRPQQDFSSGHNYNTKHYIKNYAPVQEKTTHRFRNNRKSPYMEQEYRRQWNEQLMFQENRRFSSERPYSLRQPPVYWQNYEARSAMVNHDTPYETLYNPIQNNPIRTVSNKVVQSTPPLDIVRTKNSKFKFGWLKKHKFGMSQCGEQWKKFILEN